MIFFSLVHLANKPRVPPPLKPLNGTSEAIYAEPTSPLLPPNSPKPPIPPRASQADCQGTPNASDGGYAEPDSPTVSSPAKPAVQCGYAEPFDVISPDPANIFSNPIYEEVYAEPYQGVSGTSLYSNPNDELNFRHRLDTLKDFPRRKLQFREKIGDGQFGEVHIGEVENLGEILGDEFKNSQRVTVAIKTLKVNVEKNIKEDFFKEVKVMAGLRHTNVIRLLGVCRDDPMCMIVEYMINGDLNQFLKDRILAPSQALNESVAQEREDSFISTQALMYMGQQVAAGMKYISSLNYVHRDLATRNCLVGHGYTVKIADFGMSRNLYSKHYFRIEGRVILPIRWMAPECILQGIVLAISINLLAFCHQRRSLIGYATHYLFCFGINLLAFYRQRGSLIGYATHYLFCFSINLLAFYHQRRSLIGYTTHYLFCVSINLLAFCHQRRSLIGYATHYLFCFGIYHTSEKCFLRILIG